MGQYHLVLNLDKKEFLHPHALGDGLKLMEFGSSGQGTMMALAVLLAASIKGGARGGGDLRFNENNALANAVVGRWAGDRIAIVGDYQKEGDLPGQPQDLYSAATAQAEGWVDISFHVREVLRASGEWPEDRTSFVTRAPTAKSTYDVATNTFLPIPGQVP